MQTKKRRHKFHVSLVKHEKEPVIKRLHILSIVNSESNSLRRP